MWGGGKLPLPRTTNGAGRARNFVVMSMSDVDWLQYRGTAARPAHAETDEKRHFTGQGHTQHTHAGVRRTAARATERDGP